MTHRFQQCVDELRRLCLVLSPQPEEFFELVDDEQQIRRPLSGFHQIGDPGRSCTQARQITATDPCITQGGTQALEYPFSGGEDDALPVPTGVGESAFVETGNQAGSHERRLSTAGGTQYCEEAFRFQHFQQPVHLLLATEEQVVLLEVEGTLPGKWVQGRCVNGHS